MHAEIDSRRPRRPAPPNAPRRRAGPPLRRRRPARRATSVVLQTKIRPPTPRQGVVARPALVNRLRRDASELVSVVAPAGYGKSTLLAQWAAAETRSVAWLSLDARDN